MDWLFADILLALAKPARQCIQTAASQRGAWHKASYLDIGILKFVEAVYRSQVIFPETNFTRETFHCFYGTR